MCNIPGTVRNVLHVGEIRRMLASMRCTAIYRIHSTHGWSGTALARARPHRQYSKYFPPLYILPTNLGTIPRLSGFTVSWLAQRQHRFVRGHYSIPPVGQRRAPQYHCGLCATAVVVPQRDLPGFHSQAVALRLRLAVLQRAASAHRIHSNSCVAAAAEADALQHQGRHAE